MFFNRKKKISIVGAGTAGIISALHYSFYGQDDFDVTLIRDKDDNTTARTITWPDSIKWDGGSAPTLITTNQSGHIQQFEFLTRDSGVTWYAWENMEYNPAFSFRR